MRKLFVSNLVTLDGYFEGPGNNLDWFRVDDEFLSIARQQLLEVDSILFGRVTYQMMEQYWPTAAPPRDDAVITEKMNQLPKIVFSRTLTEVNWNNSRLVKGEGAEEVARLKKQPGKDLVIFGSGMLLSEFTEKGLIDEYRLFINPVVLGAGTPQFRNLSHPLHLDLQETRNLASGVIMATYRLKKQD